jgi:dolichol-phosphate mannosyltransferase
MTAQTTVVIPTYNEAETAPILVSQLLDHGYVGEVLVVDDDSPDGTAQRVRDRAGDHDDCQIIRRTEASGLSSAVLRGFDCASCQVLTVMDGDGQHPVGAAVTGARLVCQTDSEMAVGSRRGESGEIADGWSLWRRLVSDGATGLAKIAVPQTRGLSDPMTGLFSIERELVEAVRDQLRPTGYKIALELLARCPVDSVAEFGYVFRQRTSGESNLGPKQYLEYVRHLGRLSAPSRLGATTRPEVIGDAAD